VSTRPSTAFVTDTAESGHVHGEAGGSLPGWDSGTYTQGGRVGIYQERGEGSLPSMLLSLSSPTVKRVEGPLWALFRVLNVLNVHNLGAGTTGQQ